MRYQPIHPQSLTYTPKVVRGSLGIEPTRREHLDFFYRISSEFVEFSSDT